MLNLELCNLSHLWIDATTNTKAKTISPIDQDYICLLTDVSNASTVSINMSSLSCLESIGLLQINQPRNVDNTVNISLKNAGINSFNKITCSPRSTINFSTSAPSRLLANSINCYKINMSNNIFAKIFEINTINGAQITQVSGNLGSWNNRSGIITMTNSALDNSEIYSSNITLTNTSLLNSNISTSNNIIINFTNNNTKIFNTEVSGKIITYNGHGIDHIYDNILKSDNTININDCGTVLGSVQGSNTNSNLQVFLDKVYSIQDLKTINVKSISIKTLSLNEDNTKPFNGASYINQSLNTKNSINIDGSADDRFVALTANSLVTAPLIQIKNFINYGSIRGDDIVLNNGTNYGTIKGKNINLNNVNNQGTIEEI